MQQGSLYPPRALLASRAGVHSARECRNHAPLKPYLERGSLDMGMNGLRVPSWRPGPLSTHQDTPDSTLPYIANTKIAATTPPAMRPDSRFPPRILAAASFSISKGQIRKDSKLTSNRLWAPHQPRTTYVVVAPAPDIQGQGLEREALHLIGLTCLAFQRLRSPAFKIC